MFRKLIKKLFSPAFLVLLLTSLPAQPASGQLRLLILDKNMQAWQSLLSVAEPWHAAGCRVAYRRFHPYLVQQDLQDYDMFLILAGRMPYLPSARLTREDVDILKNAIAAGKGIILGFPVPRGDDGAYDRTAMNQFLREVRARVQIGEVPVLDDENHYRGIVGRYVLARRARAWTFFEPGPLALGDLAALKIMRDARTEIFAESAPAAYFVKKNIRYPGELPVGAFVGLDGPILLLPRSALAVAGAGQDGNPAPLAAPELTRRTEDFLHAVAQRFIALVNGAALQVTAVQPNSAIPTRAQSQLAHMPALSQVPEVSIHPVETIVFTKEHFPDPEVIALQQQAAFAKGREGPIGRVLRDGIRAVTARFSPAPDGGANHVDTLERAATFLADAEINLFWNAMRAPAAPDSAGSIRPAWLAFWAAFSKASGSRPVLGLPGFDYREFSLRKSTIMGLDGRTHTFWSPLDRGLWWHEFFEPIRAVSPAIARKAMIAGFVVDTDFHGLLAGARFGMGFDFSDAAFDYFLAAARGYFPAELHRAAVAAPPERRFAFLVQNGLLHLYYKTLEEEAERFGRNLRRRAEKSLPDAIWGIHMQSLPADWYSLGLLRGLSTPGRPVVLFTYDSHVLSYLFWLQQEQIYAVHALALCPWQFTVTGFDAFFRFAAEAHHGFWIPSLEYLLDQNGVALADTSLTLRDFASILKTTAQPSQ